MKRRDFSLAAAAAVAGSATLLAGLPARAQTQAPQAGKEYMQLAQSVNTAVPAGKIEVLEFFWYSCGHCNNFEPVIAAWAKKQPQDVVVQRVPIAFQQNANYIPLQKLYYTLEALNLVDTLHIAAFETIHKERKRLNSDQAILDWATSKGVDAKKFQEAYNSFSVANAVRRATQLQDQYRVQGVPSLAVAGKYYTDGTLTGSFSRVLEVVEYLVEQERKAG